MALWLQIPLTLPADPAVQSADSASACSGVEGGTPMGSKPALANGHQPAQASDTQPQAGKLPLPP